MKLVFDDLEEPNREASPLPLVAENALGYLYVWVEPKGESVTMSYAIGRDTVVGKSTTREAQLLALMEALQKLALEVVSQFNQKMAAEPIASTIAGANGAARTVPQKEGQQ